LRFVLFFYEWVNSTAEVFLWLLAAVTNNLY
jgi:hypothetical protein